MKRFLLTLLAFLSVGCIAYGSNVPLLTGPVDPGNLRGTLNTLIQSINANVGGLLNAQTGSTGTPANTTETTLQQYTMPANTLTAAGQHLEILCFGTTAANGNNKTMRLYFGTLVVTTGTLTLNNKAWFLRMTVTRTGAATETVLSTGVGDATNVATTMQTGAISLTAGVLIKCTGENGTASANDIVATGMNTNVFK